MSKQLRIQKLLQVANTLPKGPGCYFMKNKSDEIIYVGKAKNLKSRVASYFNNSAKSPKTQILVGHIVEFEFIMTKTESESYVLENNLIKKHLPKYNIRLKDDKSYPYVMVNFNEDFPRLQYVRTPKAKKNVELFGPFPVGSNISNIIRILTKAFELRDCSKHEFNSRKEPCLLYQMNQCSAPCVGYISKDQYKKDLDLTTSFLSGEKKAKKVLKLLNEKMLVLSEEEKFEKAAMVRDFIVELDEFYQKSFKQNVEFLKGDKNVDIMAYFVGDEEIDISLYMIREGSLLGHKNFHFLVSDLIEDIESEVVSFMLQYYFQHEHLLPEKVVTHLDEEKAKVFEGAVAEINESSKKTKVICSSKKYQPLIDSTCDHARESQRVRIENQESVYVGLNRLKDLLGMKNRPRLMECYDVAIWQGKSPAASQVVFHDGKPEKKKYRHYHLKELPEGNNDFAMMKEVFTRRLTHGDLPDVFIVDGGKAQVSTVKKVLDELEIDIPICGIAKSKDLSGGNFKAKEGSKSEERLIIPGRMNPYILQKNISLFRIIVQMRDEAHRFSRRLHHNKEKKRTFYSWLDEIPGIGQVTKKQILSNLNISKEELAEMNIPTLVNYLGIKEKHARLLSEFLHVYRI